MYRIFKTATACFIILMLLLATTLGLAAVKQQQASGTLPLSGTYFTLPFDFSRSGQDTTELVRRLIESVAVFAVPLLSTVICVFAVTGRHQTYSSELSKKSTVVLLE